MTFKTTNIERIYIYVVVLCPGEFSGNKYKNSLKVPNEYLTDDLSDSKQPTRVKIKIRTLPYGIP